jgi:hypothetical protein
MNIQRIWTNPASNANYLVADSAKDLKSEYTRVNEQCGSIASSFRRRRLWAFHFHDPVR